MGGQTASEIIEKCSWKLGADFFPSPRFSYESGVGEEEGGGRVMRMREGEKQIETHTALRFYISTPTCTILMILCNLILVMVQF